MEKTFILPPRIIILFMWINILEQYEKCMFLKHFRHLLQRLVLKKILKHLLCCLFSLFLRNWEAKRKMSTGKPPPLPLRKPPGYRDPSIPIQHPPPRKAVKLPPSFHQNKRRRRSCTCCRIFCCCLCVLTAILILVFVSAGGLFYLWFQPRLPEIHLKSINFTKFNVSTTPDGPVLDAQSTIRVEIKNPNQNLGIVYDRTHVFLNAVNGDANLGEQTVPGFSQNKNNVTTLRFATKVQKEILDGKSAEELKKGFKNKNLLLNAEIRSGIGLKQSRWATNPVQVKILCGGMRLNQIKGGGSMPKCRIKMLNWYAYSVEFFGLFLSCLKGFSLTLWLVIKLESMLVSLLFCYFNYALCLN